MVLEVRKFEVKTPDSGSTPDSSSQSDSSSAPDSSKPDDNSEPDDSSTPDTPVPAKIDISKATVKVSDKVYTGKDILPTVTVTLTAKKLTSPKTKQIKLTWTKAAGGVTGYQVQIATNKAFSKGKKSYTVAKAATVSKTVTKLKKGTKYFARVRAYKTVGKTKYYGAWSAVKNVKCK